MTWDIKKRIGTFYGYKTGVRMARSSSVPDSEIAEIQNVAV